MADQIQNPLFDDFEERKEKETEPSFEPLHNSRDWSPNMAQAGNGNDGVQSFRQLKQSKNQLQAYKATVILLSLLCLALIVGISLVSFHHTRSQTAADVDAGSGAAVDEDIAVTERDITSKVSGCNASSEYSFHYACGKALDGNPRSDWASRGGGVGAWYEIYLQEPRTITKLYIMQRCNPSEQTDRMILQLGDHFSRQIELTCNLHDCETGMEEFRINPGIKASVIRITFTRVCSTQNNGLAELKVWGY